MNSLLSPKQDECVKAENMTDLPIVILYHWMYMGKVLMATQVENHPRLGTFTCDAGDFITTSPVLWINEKLGLAQTKNTLYVLRDPWTTN